MSFRSLALCVSDIRALHMDDDENHDDPDACTSSSELAPCILTSEPGMDDAHNWDELRSFFNSGRSAALPTLPLWEYELELRNREKDCRLTKITGFSCRSRCSALSSNPLGINFPSSASAFQSTRS